VVARKQLQQLSNRYEKKKSEIRRRRKKKKKKVKKRKKRVKGPRVYLPYMLHISILDIELIYSEPQAVPSGNQSSWLQEGRRKSPAAKQFELTTINQ
jgi:hypothetical protein